jgi:hypothetical protein
MRLTLAVLLIAGSAAFGQRASSASGFGRIANPGGAVPTTGGAGFGRIIYPGTGAPAVAPSRPGGAVFLGAPPQQRHTAHSAPVIVPYPVFYGGGYYDYEPPPADVAAYQQPPDQTQPSPVIIINQYFTPDTANPVTKDYRDTPLPEPGQPAPQTQPQVSPDQSSAQPSAQDSTQPIMFLIAMKDHTIYPALAYWVEGDTLNYITTQGTQNSVSLELVDREFSQQINRDRKVDFGLPQKK